MKHNRKITIILLTMFLLAQFIGIYVVSQYSPVQMQVLNNQTGQYENVSVLPLENQLPFGMQPPAVEAGPSLISIIISFTIAILLIFLLIKYKWAIIIRLWFFVVVIIALGISFNAIFKDYTQYALVIALVLAIPLAIMKVFRPRMIVHNFTELLIYPGLAAVFVPILSVWTLILLLIAISIYDMWAVWHSGVMQKMAKYQMEEVGVFAGFFVPYLNKKLRLQIKKLRNVKSKAASRIKVQLAILGGGDVVFPIIAAGVMSVRFGLVSALFVTFGAFIGLLFLLMISQKKKFYPAMPFITSGIFLGMLIWKLFF